MEERDYGHTSEAEAERLVKAGLPAETADMLFDVRESKVSVTHWMLRDNEEEEFFPCWSLGRLIKLMPKTIDGDYTLKISFDEAGYPFVMYVNAKHKTHKFKNTGCPYHTAPDCIELIDGVVEMVISLLNDGYIKKNV